MSSLVSLANRLVSLAEPAPTAAERRCSCRSAAETKGKLAAAVDEPSENAAVAV